MTLIWTPTFSAQQNALTYPIRRVKVTNTVTLEFPAETPEWQIQRTVLMYLAEEIIKRARQPLFLAGFTAALFHHVPVWKTPMQITLATQTGARSHSKIGCYSFENKSSETGVECKRLNYQLPKTAFSHVNGVPALDPYILILDVLKVKDPVEALVTADGFARKILRFSRFEKEAGMEVYSRILKDLTNLASLHFQGKHLQKILRRLSLIDPFAESAAETAVRVRLYQLGLKHIETQKRVETRFGERFGDLYLPDLNVIIEVDGNEKYRTVEDYTAEKSREVVLSELGYTVVRVNVKEILLPNFLTVLAHKLRLKPRKHPVKI